MSGGTPSQVKIPADATTGAVHNVRTIAVPNPNVTSQSSDGAGTVVPTVEEQQVVTLADGDGQVVDVEEGSLCASDETTHQLLRALCVRLDVLNSALVKHYQLPDSLWEK